MKLKIGQRVQVVKDHSEAYAPGELGTIIDFDRDFETYYEVLMDCDGFDQAFGDDEIKPFDREKNLDLI